jgi:dihydrofolate synthase/folylpolyglutamate synthase
VLISKAEFAAAVELIKPVVAELDAAQPELGPLTIYEITTMLALDWFARSGVDWVVLEVGLGGRLDATNVVTPDVAVITPISYDHTHILGKTLGAIAAEKAGIIKPGGVVVSAPQRPAAARVIAATCRERGARLAANGHARPASFRVEKPLAHQITAGEPARAVKAFFDLDLTKERLGAFHVQLNLGGTHQISNLLTALEALQAAGLELRPAAIQMGVAAVRWPGRLEPVQAERCVVLDGAHNGASSERLSEALRLHFRYERLIVVLGVMTDKDLRAILRPLASLGRLIAVEAVSPRARPAHEVARAARGLAMPADEAGGVAAGLRRALAQAGARDLVVVTGSLAVVAEAREELGLT